VGRLCRSHGGSLEKIQTYFLGLSLSRNGIKHHAEGGRAYFGKVNGAQLRDGHGKELVIARKGERLEGERKFVVPWPYTHLPTALRRGRGIGVACMWKGGKLDDVWGVS